MTNFTPWASLAGGGLIGLAAVLLFWANGRIAGVSGILAGLLPPFNDGAWPQRLAFVAGLAVAPALLALATGTPLDISIATNPPVLAFAGFLVGIGAVLGNGCTSGHGVCGLARLSPRSAVATLVFMGVAVAVVFFVRHVKP